MSKKIAREGSLKACSRNKTKKSPFAQRDTKKHLKPQEKLPKGQKLIVGMEDLLKDHSGEKESEKRKKDDVEMKEKERKTFE